MRPINIQTFQKSGMYRQVDGIVIDLMIRPGVIRFIISSGVRWCSQSCDLDDCIGSPKSLLQRSSIISNN